MPSWLFGMSFVRATLCRCEVHRDGLHMCGVTFSDCANCQLVEEAISLDFNGQPSSNTHGFDIACGSQDVAQETTRQLQLEQANRVLNICEATMLLRALSMSMCVVRGSPTSVLDLLWEWEPCGNWNHVTAPCSALNSRQTCAQRAFALPTPAGAAVGHYGAVATATC